MTVLAVLDSAVAMRWSGLGLVAAASVALVGHADLRAETARLALRYDASRAGRRLADRLSAAAIDLSPSRWRVAQALLIPPAAVWCASLTGSPGAGLWVAVLGVRMGAAGVLRARRSRRDALLEDAAVVIARHLATELGSGMSPVEALGGLRGTTALQRQPVACGVVARVAARMAVAEPLSVALSSLAAAEPAGAGRAALARLAALVASAVEGGAGTLPVRRFAEGLEARRRTAAAAAAVTAEARMAAVAVPVLSAVVAVLLASVEPSITAASLSLPFFPVVVLCAATAASGAFLVRRVTRG